MTLTHPKDGERLVVGYLVAPVLVAGHAIDQVSYRFPHLCPGEGCAIGAWLAEHYARRVYDGLPERKK